MRRSRRNDYFVCTQLRRCRVVVMSLDDVASNAGVARLNLPDGITHGLFLFRRELLVGELLGNLPMLAPGPVTGFARRPLQIGRRRCRLEAGRLTKAGRMTRQTLGIRLILGREQIKRLRMFRRFSIS